MWLASLLSPIFMVAISVGIAFLLDVGIGVGVLLIWMTYDWAALLVGFILPILITVMFVDVVTHQAFYQQRGRWAQFREYYHAKIPSAYPRFDAWVRYVSIMISLPGIRHAIRVPRSVADRILRWTEVRTRIEKVLYPNSLDDDDGEEKSTAPTSLSSTNMSSLRKRTSASTHHITQSPMSHSVPTSIRKTFRPTSINDDDDDNNEEEKKTMTLSRTIGKDK